MESDRLISREQRYSIGTDVRSLPPVFFLEETIQLFEGAAAAERDTVSSNAGHIEPGDQPQVTQQLGDPRPLLLGHVIEVIRRIGNLQRGVRFVLV